MTTTWHVPVDQLDAFATGAIDPTHAASVEAHLLRCEVCRGALVQRRPAHDGADRADAVWQRIVDEVDFPSRRVVGRSPWAMVTIGTPALMVATVGALVLVAVVPLVLDAASGRLAVAAYVTLAPLVPLLGVLTAFRPSVDPSGELGLASPLATLRLVLLRSSVVAAAALPVGVAVAFVLPAPTRLLLGWVLPGLALATAALALGRRGSVGQIVIGLSLGWAAAAGSVVLALRQDGISVALDQWVVNDPVVQVAFAAAAVVAGIAAVRDRDDVIPVWRD